MFDVSGSEMSGRLLLLGHVEDSEAVIVAKTKKGTMRPTILSICLLATLDKLLEKIILIRLAGLCNRQFEFRKRIRRKRQSRRE